MRTLPISFTNALNDGVGTICDVVLIKRKDGAIIGLTNHDRPLQFLGIDCRNDSLQSLGATRQELGIGSSGQGSLSLVLDADDFTPEALSSGAFEGARVSHYKVDWQDANAFLHLQTFWLDHIELKKHSDFETGVFIAHLEPLVQALERSMGRRFGRLCDAAFGDARCGLDAGYIAGKNCDKRYKTCHETHNNRLNFRGFPDMAGEDVLGLYPRDDQAMSGQKRNALGR